MGMALFLTLAVPYRFYGMLQLPNFASFSIVEPVLLVALAFVGIRALYSGRITLGPRVMLFSLGLPVLLTTLSLSWSVNFSDTLKAVFVHFEALFAYLVVMNLLQGGTVECHVKVLRAFTVLVLVAAVFSYSPLGLFPPQIPPDLAEPARAAFELSYHARLSHPYIGLSNNLATILAFVAPLLVALAFAVRSRWNGVLAALCVAALLATMSRGVTLGLVLAVLLFSFWHVLTTFYVSRRLIIVVIGLMMFSWLGLLLFVFLSPAALQHLGGRFTLGNVDSRLVAYKLAWEAAWAHPLTGYGAGVGLDEVALIGLESVHNAYLQALYWYGVPLGGLAALVLIFLPAFAMGLPATSHGARLFRNGLFVALLAQVLANMFEASWEGSMLRLIIYALLGLSLSLIQALRREGSLRERAWM